MSTWQIARTSHREGVNVSYGAAGSNPDVLISHTENSKLHTFLKRPVEIWDVL
nr:MAG TPA: hypothetical protein [Caudoviricetes sp.]DAQ51220.1 MAG TPA: hypothetical protein [Caudoviricetes sp.]